MEILNIHIPGTEKIEAEKSPEFDSIKSVDRYLQKQEAAGKSLEVDFATLDETSADFWLFSRPLRAYRASGFTQNIVNAVADDATRKGFTINVTDAKNADENAEINRLIQDRLLQLNYFKKMRDTIKFSRIFQEGAGLYYGVISGNEETLRGALDLNEPLPDTIKEIQFISVLESPDYFNYTFDNIANPTLKNYLVPTITISGRKVHTSRVSLIINEFDAATQIGISIVEKLEPAIVAQDSGIKGAAHILQRVGAVLFSSDEMDVKINTRATISKIVRFIKNKIKSDGAMGMRSDDKLEMLSHSFSGIKEVYEYVLDNMAGLSNLPKSKLIGAKKGGVISGSDDDLINYFMDIESYQENTLEPIDRVIVDLIFKEEKNDALKKITNNKVPMYEILYNPLWSLSEKEQADNRKLNAEADKIDVEIGKSVAPEVRANDERYAGMPNIAEPPEDMDET